MKNNRYYLFALVAILHFAFCIFNCPATTITENFATDPAADGWKIFGDASLLQWDSTNQNLAVTWDSSQPNSYFYHPLGTILGRNDDFSASFDLQINDITAGVNPNKPDAIEVALGFFNFAQATNNIVRASPVYSPSGPPDPQNMVEFDYFPYCVDPDFGPSNPSIAPTIISSDYVFDGAFGDYFTFTNGVSYHVQSAYTSSNQSFTTTVTLTGQTNVLITAVAILNNTNDFRVDTFSVSCYSDMGDDYDSAPSATASWTISSSPFRRRPCLTSPVASPTTPGRRNLSAGPTGNTRSCALRTSNHGRLRVRQFPATARRCSCRTPTPPPATRSIAFPPKCPKLE